MMFKSEIKRCGVDKREIVLVDYPKFSLQIMMALMNIVYWGRKVSNSVTTIFWKKFSKKANV
jgi:hypothetical protein